jgi:cytochrome b involved in lipid metabolism
MEPLPLAPETDIPEKAAVTTQPSTDASYSVHVEKADDNGPKEGNTSFLKLNADNVVADEAATGESKSASSAEESKTTTPGAKTGESKEAKTITRADTEEDVPSLKMYTTKDVSSHNKPDDLWLVVGGDIFNVTKFQHEHPGGAKSQCKHNPLTFVDYM